MTKTKLETFFDEELINDPTYKTDVENAKRVVDIAMQIYNLRKAKGLSQIELARKVNMSQSNIARLENATYEGYSKITLEKIAKALDADLNILLTSPEITKLISRNIAFDKCTYTSFTYIIEPEDLNDFKFFIGTSDLTCPIEVNEKLKNKISYIDQNTKNVTEDSYKHFQTI